MRLAKIKNRYMYKTGDDDHGAHWYAVFFNRKERRYNAVQLTHLYKRDDRRFEQVKKGNIKIEKFKEFDVPSGVKRQIYHSNAKGGAIDMKDGRFIIKITKRHLSKKQSERIKRFVGKKKVRAVNRPAP